MKASFHRDYAQTQNTLEQVRQFVKLRYFDTISLFLVRLGRLEITNTSGEKSEGVPAGTHGLIGILLLTVWVQIFMFVIFTLYAEHITSLI